MLKTYESGKTTADKILSGTLQQDTRWFARHTQDVSDASLAQFERLMTAMGYRRQESTDRQAA